MNNKTTSSVESTKIISRISWHTLEGYSKKRMVLPAEYVRNLNFDSYEAFVLQVIQVSSAQFSFAHLMILLVCCSKL